MNKPFTKRGINPHSRRGKGRGQERRGERRERFYLIVHWEYHKLLAFIVHVLWMIRSWRMSNKDSFQCVVREWCRAGSSMEGPQHSTDVLPNFVNRETFWLLGWSIFSWWCGTIVMHCPEWVPSWSFVPALFLRGLSLTETVEKVYFVMECYERSLSRLEEQSCWYGTRYFQPIERQSAEWLANDEKKKQPANRKTMKKWEHVKALCYQWIQLQITDASIFWHMVNRESLLESSRWATWKDSFKAGS